MRITIKNTLNILIIFVYSFRFKKIPLTHMLKLRQIYQIQCLPVNSHVYLDTRRHIVYLSKKIQAL